MKIINLLIGFSILFLPLKTYSQEETSLPLSITYDLEFIFTGQVYSGSDSVFTVSYVFNKADLENVSKLILKTDSTEKHFSLDKETKPEGIKELNDKLYMNIGIISPSKKLPLVEAMDTIGNLFKLTIVDKSGDNYFPIKDTLKTDTISEEKKYDIKPNEY